MTNIHIERLRRAIQSLTKKIQTFNQYPNEVLQGMFYSLYIIWIISLNTGAFITLVTSLGYERILLMIMQGYEAKLSY